MDQPAAGGSLWAAWRTGWLSPSDVLQGSSPGMNGLVGDGVILADLEGLDVTHCKSSQ